MTDTSRAGGGPRQQRDTPWFSPQAHAKIDRFVNTNRLTPGGTAETALRGLGWQALQEVIGDVGGNSFKISADARDPDGVVLSRIRRIQGERL